MKTKFVTSILCVALLLSLFTYLPGFTPMAAAADTAVTAAVDPSTFTDISGHWAKSSIEAALTQGWFNGTTATTFSPDRAVSRGMFVTILGRMMGVNSTATSTAFTDVPADAYYAPYVAWAYENQITGGTTATTFSPDRPITREQLATMLNRFNLAEKVSLPAGQGKTFADAQRISSWATDAVAKLTSAGIISGKANNAFDPQGTATRAQTAVILLRYAQVVASGTPISDGQTLVVDMMDTVSSMDSVAEYISAFTMTYHFTNDAVSSITEDITLTQDMTDEATISELKSSLSTEGTVAVDGRKVIVTLNDISDYDGMTKAEVKTALEDAGYTVAEG